MPNKLQYFHCTNVSHESLIVTQSISVCYSPVCTASHVCMAHLGAYRIPFATNI